MCYNHFTKWGGFMVREKIRGNLIVISGPSGCGKGTICSELLKNNPDKMKYSGILNVINTSANG